MDKDQAVRWVFVFLAGAISASAIQAALADEQPANLEIYQALDVLAEAYGIARREHVDPPDSRTLMYGAVRGMIRALDAHSDYLSPEALARFRDNSRGRFAGLGMQINAHGMGLTIAKTLPNTPAARAKLRTRDQIVRIDDALVRDLGMSDAVRLLRGAAGTHCRLQISRPPPIDTPDMDSRLFEVTLTREIIRIEPVESALISGVAHVRINTFQSNTAKYVRTHIQTLLDQGARGVVLDLRGNPGGLLHQAVKISDLFLDEGLIVRTIGREKKELRRWTAGGGSPYATTPLVVLVNSSSASASEIVAGALKDHQRAQIVGQRTYGKGSVQTLRQLSDGSALKLTIALYQTASGQPIQDRGILPDIAIPPGTPDARALRRAIDAVPGRSK